MKTWNITTDGSYLWPILVLSIDKLLPVIASVVGLWYYVWINRQKHNRLCMIVDVVWNYSVKCICEFKLYLTILHKICFSMHCDEDFALALQLQEEFVNEVNSNDVSVTHFLLIEFKETIFMRFRFSLCLPLQVSL
jgi:hypothetical protein